jgi:hypothetical protein
MGKRKINLTFEIEDNDFIQQKVEQRLFSILGKNMIDFRVFPNTEHLKENKSFKKLVKSKREAGLELDRFINNNRK